jgi:hypothetical protein
MNLKPLLIHKLLDCFEHKYNTRLSRGGSWYLNAGGFGAANRYGRGPTYRNGLLGFRLSKQANEFETPSNPQTA